MSLTSWDITLALFLDSLFISRSYSRPRGRKGKTRTYALPSITAFYHPAEKAVC
jgi:hypothetical protein